MPTTSLDTSESMKSSGYGASSQLFVNKEAALLERAAFTEQDYKHLEQMLKSLPRTLREVAVDYQAQMKKATEMQANLITVEIIEKYMKSFFVDQRDSTYTKRASQFYQLLRSSGYPIDQAIGLLNNMNYIFLNPFMMKRSWFKGINKAYVDTIQRAVSLEMGLLVNVYMDNVLIMASTGLAALIDKNTEISHIRNLLAKIDQQLELSYNVSSATEELNSSIEDVSNNITLVADQTSMARQDMNDSKDVIVEALEDIVHSDIQFESIHERFNELSNCLSDIHKVVAVIDSIANQTNILALNASIEASRAGEGGRGFSVVAAEIRNLANSTKSSLQAVHKHVDNMNQLADEVSLSIDGVSELIKEGVLKANKATPKLQSFVDEMNQISVASESIASITEQQSAAVAVTANQVSDMVTLTEDLAVLASDSVRAINDLSSLTENYRNLLFTNQGILPLQALLQLAKTDHTLWKWRVYNMTLGYVEVRPEQVNSHHECRLGQWYFNQLTMRRFQNNQTYTDLDEPHRMVHKQARLAAEAYARGDMDAVNEAFKQLELSSMEVVTLIDRLLEQV